MFRQLLNRLRIHRADIELSVLVVNPNQAAFFDSERTSQPLWNDDLQVFSAHFRNSFAALNQLVTTSTQRYDQLVRAKR
jgi:hypothetical protein